MKIVVAIDSFKGSISSLQAGNSVALGIRRVKPDADIKIYPIADGGEGTVSALVSGMGGQLKKVKVKNPLYEDIIAEYGILGKTAIIEMAASSGIALLKKERLNPMLATTYGVGQMIKDAIESGCDNFVIGIGGSATNDGGVGMLMALGYEFLDANGKSISFGAKGLADIVTIKDDKVIPKLKDCSFSIACDVKNPLCGEMGCSAVFSPQKGARHNEISVMDKALSHYAEITKQKYQNADMNYPGAGAAGGLGFAFLSYLNASLNPGIDLILREINIEKDIIDADLVITGEGRIDSQTIMGKAPIGIAKLSKKYNKPVIAFSGCVTRDANVCNGNGIDAIFPIVRSACSLEDAMNEENAMNNMADCVEQAIRLFVLK